MNLVINMEFGKYLTSLRERNGYKSQRQLALEAKIAPATLSRIEAGIQKPNPETLLALSRVLRDIPYEKLMGMAGYLSSESSDITSMPDPEREFIRWVKENVSSTFFYDFDSDPEESKAQMMRDLRYLYDRDRKRKN